MTRFLSLALCAILVSCGSQNPEKYTYDLKTPYRLAKAKISAFNKSSKTSFGWTTNNVKFPEVETIPNQTFTFNRVEWAPDLGNFPTFNGVLVRKGSRSELTIMEQASRDLGYSDPKPFFAGEGPDKAMATFDAWVTKNLLVERRSVVSPE